MRINEEWHLDKSVSLGHILTTIVLVASAVTAFTSLSERMSIVEDKIITILENQTKIDRSQDQNLAEFKVDMRNRQVDINNKLETILNHLLQQN
jgi:ABC-type transporter Mla maintaining outer membrane lipid asymmetry ATPase subunit MlaF